MSQRWQPKKEGNDVRRVMGHELECLGWACAWREAVLWNGNKRYLAVDDGMLAKEDDLSGRGYKVGGHCGGDGDEGWG